MTKAPDDIVRLVEQFDEHRENYRRGDYNETQLRRDFLDPFFAALGWDIHNRQGYAEAYRDVIHEDALRVEKTIKAPDYSFRVGGVRKFFVEAKKPSVDIRQDTAPAFQLRRYAWTAKLPLSILTDFEEFAVYDCRVKPDKDDKASEARISILRYTDYLERWAEIADVFSREAVLRGSFDKYAESTKKKRGTAEVDDAFLEEIESWREAIARNLSLRNDEISDRELNFSVQRIIDRIIFLRMCEGRGIEPFGRLQALLNGHDVYKRLVELFHRADEKYNSGLFHFQQERGREPPDELTGALAVDDKVLKDIITRLYYPESPYEFAALPADILGQVYERFLGKVIRLTAGHRAKIEEKPEVRKAGGVYYTPTYIVDYIVANTVGKLLEKKTPQEAGGLTDTWKMSKTRRPLTVLDPACGSGSFLIVAYQYLLDWYLKQYTEHSDPAKHARSATPRVYQFNGRDWRLTTSERKRILLSHIYGVDVDYQAVEVTKLSLLLKVLEGETEATLAARGQLFHKLPDLADNIKCGNSLIGPDFYADPQMSLLDEEKQFRINAFDWQSEFKKIFNLKDKGFDAVIGNPPYVNAWELFEAMPQIRDYINTTETFATATRHWDLYILFLEKALELARRGGRISFIIPFSFAIQKYGELLRQLLLKRSSIESIADLRSVRVFGRVPVITVIPVIVSSPPMPKHRIVVMRPGPHATKTHPGTIVRSHSVSQRVLLHQKEHMLRLDFSDETLAICDKIDAISIRVGEVCWVNYGAQMSSRKKGVFGKEFVLRNTHATTTCRKTIAGRNLYRYLIQWDGMYVEWALADQMYGSRGDWFFETPKLMVRDITGTHRLELAVDRTGLYCDHTVLCALRYCDIARFRKSEDNDQERSRRYQLPLLQGFLASRVVSAYYYWKLSGEGVRIGGGFHTYPTTVRQLPMINLDKLDRSQAIKADELSRLSDKCAKLGEQYTRARTPNEKLRLKRQIDASDIQIDQLVYELIGLTDDEIRLVEDATP